MKLFLPKRVEKNYLMAYHIKCYISDKMSQCYVCKNALISENKCLIQFDQASFTDVW